MRAGGGTARAYIKARAKTQRPASISCPIYISPCLPTTIRRVASLYRISGLNERQARGIHFRSALCHHVRSPELASERGRAIFPEMEEAFAARRKSYETRITDDGFVQFSGPVQRYGRRADYPLREREPSWILGRDSSRLFSTSQRIDYGSAVVRSGACEKCCLLTLPTHGSFRSDGIRTIPLSRLYRRPDVRICFHGRNVRVPFLSRARRL